MSEEENATNSMSEPHSAEEELSESINSVNSEIKTPESPKSSPKIKPNLSDRSIQGIPVYLVKNSYPRDSPKRYRAKDLEKLLLDSEKILSLTSHAKRIYTENGKIISNFDDVVAQTTYYISCGEKFGHGMPSPPKKQATSGIGSPSPPASPTTRSQQAKMSENSPTGKDKVPLTLAQRRQREVEAFNRLVALSHSTYQDNFRDASSSMYASLTTGQRKQLTGPEELEKLHNDTQEYYLMNQLLKCSICPTTSMTVVTDLLNTYCMDLFKGMELDDMKFAVAGPRQSGKSSLVYTMTTRLMRKLQLCDEYSQYLFMTLNFEQETLYLTDVMKLLLLFVNRTFECAYFSNLVLVPAIRPLQQWFISQIMGTNPQLPTVCDQVNVIDTNKIFDIIHKIKQTLKSDETNGLETFIQLVCDIPELLGSALGFKKVIFIIDSFEYSYVQIFPSENYFSYSKGYVTLADALCNALNKNLYITSMQNEELFMECFTCPDAMLLDTDKLLESYQNSSVIDIHNPSLRLTIKDCSGCPGYIVQFLKLVERIDKANNNVAIKTKHSLLQTHADISRLKIIRLELVRFCHLIESAGHTKITKDLLNQLNNEDEELIIKAVNPEGTNLNEFSIGAENDSQKSN